MIRDSKDLVEMLRNGLLQFNKVEQTTLDAEAGVHQRLAKSEDMIRYVPTVTGQKFHLCDDLVRGFMGPYGSGKSVACSSEIYYRACEQEVVHKNVRETRCIVLRNTAQELRDTTIATLLEWLPDGPDGVGTFYKSQQLMRFRLGRDKQGRPFLPHPSGDGTFVSCDIIFRAVDRVEQLKKLLSAEYTFGWINEFREVPHQVVTALVGRIGRFPGKKKTTFRGVWMDTNPFDENSSYDRMFSGETPPEIADMCEKEGLEPPRFTLFEQPGGMSPDAENLENLDGGRGYYVRMLTAAKLEGRSDEWVNVHVHGKRGALLEGKPVWGTTFNRDIHVKDHLAFNPALPLYAGMDFGLTPAILFGQLWPNRQWTIIGELQGDNIAAAQFAHEIKSYVQNRDWPINTLRIFGDPAGGQRAQTDLRTVFSVLRAARLRAQAARHQSPQIRIDSVRATLQGITYDGAPRMLIDRSACPQWIKTVSSGYVWKETEGTSPKPLKNKYSHLADAGQYLISQFEGAALQSVTVTDVEGIPQATGMEPGQIVVESSW